MTLLHHGKRMMSTYAGKSRAFLVAIQGEKRGCQSWPFTFHTRITLIAFLFSLNASDSVMELE